MKIIYNKYIPFKGFTAINLFGVVFVRTSKTMSRRMINHERIHTAQMKEMMYVPFYILYLIEYIFRVFQYKFKLHKAYRNISFEREAYTKQSVYKYLDKRTYFSWLNYLKR